MKASFSHHLIQLLYRNDCVIVPNFGGFLTEREPAKIHPVSHRFMPPRKSVIFNPRLENNDGLLANAISAAEEIPYKDAVKKLLAEASKVKAALEKGETVELEELGKLVKGLEGNITFVPYEELNLLAESYGLSQFRSNFVVREESQAAKKHIYQTAEDIINSSNEKKTVKVQKWWYAAAAAALLVSVGVWGSFNQDKAKEFYKNYAFSNPFAASPEQSYQPRENTIEPLNQPEDLIFPGSERVVSEEVKNAKSIVQKLDKKKQENTLEAEALKPELKKQPEAIKKTEAKAKPVVEKKNTAPKKVVEKKPVKVEPKAISASKTTVSSYSDAKYLIIAGCFAEEPNANKLVSKLSAKGYPAITWKAGAKQLSYVAFGGYTSKAEALQALKKVKANDAKDAWLMVK